MTTDTSFSQRWRYEKIEVGARARVVGRRLCGSDSQGKGDEKGDRGGERR